MLSLIIAISVIINSPSSIDSNIHKTPKTKKTATIKTSSYPTKTNIEAKTKILFNELMINPSGTDKGKEWIELYNPNDFPVSLTNWSIQKEGSKTAEIINNLTINPKTFTCLDLKKITLKNTDEHLFLVNSKREISDEIQVEGVAKENQTYSLIESLSEKEDSNWQWEDYVTKCELNPSIHEFEGIIENIDLTKTKMELINEKEIILIYFPNINIDLAEQLFRKNNKIKVTAKKIGENFFLENYEILEKAPLSKNETSKIPFLIGGIIIVIIGFYKKILIKSKPQNI